MDPARWAAFGLITRSRRFDAVLCDAARIAGTDLSVLIAGESGVGKDLVARLIHHLSGRHGALVGVNCAALPASVIEAELFGSVRGAFTGAENRTGLVAAAEAGTLFLDEVGTMPRELQAKLLRFLELREYRPVGSSRARTADCRIVGATNADLAAAIARGDFREDLFYRLAGAELEVPPLRRRRCDIALLVDHFSRERFDRLPSASGVDREMLALLAGYGWPGNVRELRHVIHRARSRCREGDRLVPRHLTAAIRRRLAAGAMASAPERGADRSRGHSTEAIEAALREHGGNVRRAAQALGISRQQVYRRIRELRLELDRYRR
jgi:transcriptional regulator with PAS, ATPase and Fis domain